MKYIIKGQDLEIIPETPLDHFYVGQVSVGYPFFVKENYDKQCVEGLVSNVSIIIRALADGTRLKMIEEE